MALFAKRKRPQVIGLDVGSSSVKAVELKRAGSSYHLTGFGLAELPSGVVEGGEIRNPAKVRAAISAALSQARIETRDAVIGVSGGSVIAKRVKLPKMSQAELEESIRWEAEQHIPFDTDDVNLDFQIVDKGGQEIEVMLVAVKKGRVESYVEVAEAAGLKVVVVDADVFALENQFEVNYPELKGEVVALVNVGAEVTNTNIIQRGNCVYARDILFGGRQIVGALGRRLGIDPAQAEPLLRDPDAGGSFGSEVENVSDSVTQELGTEIQRTLDYFGTTGEHERISQILLGGGCALLPGLRERLTAQWGIEVGIVDPFRNVETEVEHFPGDEIKALGPRLAVAMGLAMRWPGDRS
jgi:type IV pilus assembly protein PilM